MGKHLTYYPQEHYVDRPVVPAHKRANECSGLIGAEAILYGMIGLDPRIDGSLWINPQVPASENISVKGYGCRTNSFDLEFSKDNMRIIKNNVTIYEGKAKRIKLL